MDAAVNACASLVIDAVTGMLVRWRRTREAVILRVMRWSWRSPGAVEKRLWRPRHSYEGESCAQRALGRRSHFERKRPRCARHVNLSTIIEGTLQHDATVAQRKDLVDLQLPVAGQPHAHQRSTIHVDAEVPGMHLEPA